MSGARESARGGRERRRRAGRERERQGIRPRTSAGDAMMTEPVAVAQKGGALSPLDSRLAAHPSATTTSLSPSLPPRFLARSLARFLPVPLARSLPPFLASFLFRSLARSLPTPFRPAFPFLPASLARVLLPSLPLSLPRSQTVLRAPLSVRDGDARSLLGALEARDRAALAERLRVLEVRISSYSSLLRGNILTTRCRRAAARARGEAEDTPHQDRVASPPPSE